MKSLRTFALAAAALLVVGAGTSQAQYIYKRSYVNPYPVVVPSASYYVPSYGLSYSPLYSRPAAYGPYYGGGLSYIQPYSTPYVPAVPSYGYGAPGYGASFSIVRPGASFSLSFGSPYYTPGYRGSSYHYYR